MTRKKMVAVGLVLVVALSCGLVALAQGRGGGADGPGGPLRHMMKALGLSDAQKQQVLDIASQHWKGELGDAVNQARLALRDVKHAVHDPAATDDQINAAVQAAVAPAQRAALARHRMMADIAKVLTPEQVQKMQDLEAGREKMGDRRFGAMDGFLGAD